MTKYSHPAETADWLRAHGVNVNRVPADSDMTITTDPYTGRRTIHYEEFICDEEGRVIAFGGESRTDWRSVLLTVDPPDSWRPYEKPREQLGGALDEVLDTFSQVRQAETGTVLGYSGPRAIDPRQFEQWRTVLNPPATEEQPDAR